MLRRILVLGLWLACASPALGAITSPTAISGVRLWLDGNDVDGNGISAGAGETYAGTWVDKSGLANNFTQATAGFRPTRTLSGIGGKDSFTFDNADDFFSGPAILAANDDNYTYFAVWKPNTASGIHSVYEQAGAGGSARSAILQVGAPYGFNGEGNDAHIVPLAANVTRLTDMQVNNALTNNNIRIFDNGSVYLATSSGGSAALNVGTAGATIGRKQQVSSEFMSGQIAEVIVYDRTLSSSEHADVNNYLNSKWGLGLTVPVAGLDSIKHRWSFTTGPNQQLDSVGTANITTLFDSPTFANNKVVLNGADHMLTSAINSTIGERTFVAWVANTDLNQGGGAGVIGLQNPGSVFDSMVYGEVSAKRWMAGSDFFNRTQAPQTFGFDETSTNEIMLAIVYKDDSSIELYRDGALYGSYQKGSLINFLGGSAFVNFGQRLNGAGPEFDGILNEARIYGSALSAAEIARLYGLGPNALQSLTELPEPSSVALWIVMGLAGGFGVLKLRRSSARGVKQELAKA